MAIWRITRRATDIFLELHPPTFLPPSSGFSEIGPSPLLPLLAVKFVCAVDSLGLEPEGDGPLGHHFHFDLNSFSVGSTSPQMPRTTTWWCLPR